MMNKQDVKKVKKIIKFKNMSKWVFYLDKYTKTMKLKIKNMVVIEETDVYTMYRAKFNLGANLFNPLTWIIFIIPVFLTGVIEVFKGLWQEMKTNDYTTTLKIKK